MSCHSLQATQVCYGVQLVHEDVLGSKNIDMQLHFEEVSPHDLDKLQFVRTRTY
jgi:hypothetical protein